MVKLIRVACAVLALCAIAGCGKSSVDIAAQVKGEMQEELVKKTGLKNLVVDDVVLVKERPDGIDYTGVATGTVDGEEVKFDVACKYDGHSLVWKAELSEGCMAALAAKEKAKEWYGMLKDGVKRSSAAVAQAVEEASESVKKAAGETYDAAKKAAGEYYDSAKSAVTNLAEQAKQKMAAGDDTSSVNETSNDDPNNNNPKGE